MLELIKEHQLDIMLSWSSICAIMAFFVLVTGINSKKKRALFFLELDAAFLLMFDRYAYIYRGDVSRLGYYMVRISNFLVFFTTLQAVFWFAKYLKETLAESDESLAKHKIFKAIDLLSLLGILMLVISQFTGFYYTFDEYNRYVRSKGFMLCYILPLGAFLMLLPMVLRYYKKLSKGMRLPLLLFSVVPLIASVLQVFLYGISFTNLTMVGLIALLYIFDLLDMNRTAAESEKRISATADIYISMYEANLLTDTFTEVYNNKAITKAHLGDAKSNARQTIRTLYERFVDPSTKEKMLEFVDLSTLGDRMKDVNTITNEFLTVEDKWRRARFIVSKRTPSGTVESVLFLVEDIDAEKRERDMTVEAVRMMNDQISSVANIYFEMHDIDLKNDMLREIKSDASDISEMIAEPVEHAQQVAYEVIDLYTHDMSKEVMRKFVDFSTFEERFADTNVITEEFFNIDNIWCRARLVLSKRDEEGKVEHVLWLIESIDEEKRRRDLLAETAQRLNYRITSIVNSYISAYELDLTSDTVTTIKFDENHKTDEVGETRGNAQEDIRSLIPTFTDESYLNEVYRFYDLSTLPRRLSHTDSVAIEYLNRDKKWQRVRIVASRRDAAGKLTHVIAVTEDIDHEKRERDKLMDMSERAIAASEAKSSFLSHMSHEIRTPINAVLGMNEMILRESEDPNILQYSSSIRTAGSTLLGLVNDILDFSKIEAGKMEIIPVDYDLSSVINDLVNMIKTKADAKGLALELDIDRAVPKFLHGDEVRIKQVITNLLTNAVKYTETGTVTFCIEMQKHPEESEEVILEISVIDTGIGIKKEDMSKLFSEFDRIEEERNRKVEGTGLGMSITKSLLEMMDSRLEVESIYGMGSRFSFELRQTVVKWEAIGDYEAAYKASLEARERYHERFRAPEALILVVDDTPENLTVIRSLLKRTCVQIDTADSGDEGLVLARQKKYDMIFLDDMMPGKGGIETLHELKAEEAGPNLHTPTVCLTANAISGARERYLSEGFDEYLTKPIDTEKLEKMLQDHLPKEKLENAE